MLDLIFGCGHKNFSFPLTNKRERRTYVVCTTCGKEYEYSWAEMRIVQEVQKAQPAQESGEAIAET